MAKKNITYEIKMGAPEYMNTYGDMMTLLLCFFVLLFAMSNIDAKKFEAIVMSFQGSLGVLDGGNTLSSENKIEKGSVFDNQSTSVEESSKVAESSNFEKMEKQIKEYLKENKLENQISISNEEEGLVLRFQDSSLFDQGSATLKPQSYNVLKYVGGILKSSNFKDKFITVEGHTDNVPISNSIHQSNWELSGNRASNVVRYLIENQGIDPKRLSTAGYGEYHPVAPNDTPENMAKNRRVDIMILRTKDSKAVKK